MLIWCMNFIKKYTIHIFLLFVSISFLSITSTMEGGNIRFLTPGQDFGNVQFSKNTNGKVSGVGNTGVIANNENIQLTSSNSVLNLSDNSNVKLQTEDSRVSLLNCLNIKFFGKANIAILMKNTNTKFEGENTQVEARDNENFQVKCKQSKLTLLNNTNVKIDVEKGHVIAEDNVNLKISGEDSNVNVKDTENHELRRLTLPPGGEGVNKVELSVDTPNSWNINPIRWIANAVTPGGSENVKFTVDYVDRVEIEGENYKVGAFDFTLKKKSAGKYEVKLGEGGTFETERVGKSEIIVRLRREQVTQSLKLCGPVVCQKELLANAFAIDLTGGTKPTSNI